jgi:hypothetical protein
MTGKIKPNPKYKKRVSFIEVKPLNVHQSTHT